MARQRRRIRSMTLHKPLGLLAELTHRCPLGCPYCSNPLALDRARRTSSTPRPGRGCSREAAGARRAAGASVRRRAGRAARPRRDRGVGARGRALHQPHHLGRRHHHAHHARPAGRPGSTTCRSRSRTATRCRPTISPAIDGAFQRKHALAAEVVRLEAAAHRQSRGAPRQHRAHRRHGRSRAGAQREPDRDRARAVLRLGAEEPRGADADPRAGRARGRGGRGAARASTRAASSSTRWCRTITRAIPSPASAAGAGARSTSRRPARCCRATPRNRSRAWNSGTCATIRSPTSGRQSPAFNAFRGTDCLPEPCASCERREIDFGGCRCQAFALTGDARATDPVCHLSPAHALVARACGGARRPAVRLPAHVRRTLRCERRIANSIARTGNVGNWSRQGRDDDGQITGEDRNVDFRTREDRMTQLLISAAACCSRGSSSLVWSRPAGRARRRPASARSTRSKPADSKQDTNLKPHPTPPIATAADKLPLDKIKLPAGFKAEVWSQRPSRRAHHGDGRQGHHVHGHAR